MKSPSLLHRLHGALTTAGRCFAPLLLLFIRLYWGWQYHVTGQGKLSDLSHPTQFFASLHIPAPHLNAIVVSVTECFGGLLLMVGLGTRFLVPIFIVEMLIAFITADRASFLAIFSDPDKFTGAAPFLFLASFLVLFAFGPGVFSLDALIFKRERQSSPRADREGSGGPGGI
ncbi:MAG TPA: DoxX family protein [Opitutaceae bacterium]|jgi:putative oxidoreductase